MTMTGGCYCGALRYEVTGRPLFKAQCHCRACQHIAGGGPNYFMVLPPDGFAYVTGAPKRFARPDLEQPVTREFCETCGTHITTRRPDLNGVVLKVGTLDDPAAFGGPKAAIFMEDRQPFHIVADDVPCFETLPTGG
ncbi:GFA family protein [Pontivivens ytuae]|uniref:GFA family protein n=1 Tax=Pontivivens ytuae TaxID=2789856 RepID=A0A7S9LQ15_9RHOB|nr:GFA family protein [Pontivivens ytuae]QPH52635.1 GFA family protein [Pontivivens ytuae]